MPAFGSTPAERNASANGGTIPRRNVFAGKEAFF
jgi:hypothetical protein